TLSRGGRTDRHNVRRVLAGAPLEDGGARDERIGACRRDEAGGFWRYSAIYLDTNVTGADHRLQFRDLVHGRGDEGLTAEAGIDRHDQHQIDEIKNILDARHRGCRIENGASFFTKRTDRLQRTVKMRPGLDMHRNRIRPGFREAGKIGIARGDHEMHVKRDFRKWDAGPHFRGAGWWFWESIPPHYILEPLGGRPAHQQPPRPSWVWQMWG